MIIYERKMGFSWRPFIDTLELDETYLRRRVSSGTRANREIPIDKIKGFYAENVRIDATGMRKGIAAASQAIVQTTGMLLINWEKDGKVRKESFPVDVGSPEFLSLYIELKERHPDACFEGLSEPEAKKKLGRLSQKVQAILFIVAVIGGAFLWAGIKFLFD